MWGIAMKKKVDKDKRKILKYTTLSVIAMYFSSLIMLFFAVYFQETYNLYDEASEIISFEEFKYAVLEQDEKITTENFIPQYFEESFYYYSAVALYSENGELVHTNGTILSFLKNNKRRYCYLDEYISEDDYDNIIEFGEKVDGQSYVSCESFKYIENENNEIVPVELILSGVTSAVWNIEETRKDIKLTLKFSDYTNDSVEFVDENIYLNMRDIEVFDNKADSYLYRKLIEQVKSEEDREYGYKNLKANEDNVSDIIAGGGFYGGSEACYGMRFKLLDKPYFVVIRIEFNPLIAVLSDGNFQVLAFSFGIFTIVLFCVIRRCISLYYDKKKKLEEAKNTLTSATAHELKTPISIIQNQCECIMENIAPEKNEEYVKSIYVESQRMNKIVCDFLQYNRLVQAEEIVLKETDLTVLIKEEVAKYEDLFKQNQKSVKIDLCEDAIVKVNPEMIGLVINNFFSNAVKHSDRGGDIEIKLERVQGNKLIKFSVYNSGSKLEDGLQGDVWDALYKADESRTEKGTSGGMGLAISSRILELHKFSYGCKNVKNGVEFWFFI